MNYQKTVKKDKKIYIVGNMKHKNQHIDIVFKVILSLCISSIVLGCVHTNIKTDDMSQRETSLEEEINNPVVDDIIKTINIAGWDHFPEEEADSLDIDDVTLTTMTIYFGEGVLDCPDTLIIENINLRVKRGASFDRYGPYGFGSADRRLRSFLTDTDILTTNCRAGGIYWRKGTATYRTIIDSISMVKLSNILQAFTMSSASCMWNYRNEFLMLKANTNTTMAVDTNITAETVASITNISSFRAVTIGNTTWLKLPTEMLPETDTNAIVAADINITTGAVTAMTNVGPLEVVTIGGKTWLKRNLNIATDSSWCHFNDPDICAKYGRLYNWNAAVKACDALGDGWRLPDTADWNALIEAVGGREIAGTKLKSKTDWHLDNGGNTPIGTDTFGFSALPGGLCYHITKYSCISKYGYVGDYGVWWSSTKVTDYLYMVYLQIMGYYSESVGLGSNCHTCAFGASVRCMRD
jgi:uncharacterized protein (TIGR02145 family)